MSQRKLHGNNPDAPEELVGSLRVASLLDIS